MVVSILRNLISNDLCACAPSRQRNVDTEASYSILSAWNDSQSAVSRKLKAIFQICSAVDHRILRWF